MVTITDHTSLEKWLQGRETQVAAVIAVRAALRVLPLISENWRGREANDWRAALILPALHAALVSRVATLVPIRETKVAFADFATESSATHNAAFAAFDAYNAAFAAIKVYNAPNAPNAANVGGAWTYSAYSNAVNAARAAVRASSGAVWREISLDTDLFDDGKSVEAVLTGPLWQNRVILGKIPAEIERAWNSLKFIFDHNPATWGFWRDWYQKVLDGQHQRPELLHDIALLPNEDWEAGPERVAERIAGLQAKHIPLAYPMAERVEFNLATAKLRVVPTPPPEPRLFAMGVQKVRDEIAEFGDLERRTNAYSALLPVLKKLSDRIANYADSPQRIHDELLLAMESILYLLNENLTSDGVEIQALLRVFSTTCLDIRSTMDAVNATYIRRVDMRLVEMAEDKKETLVLVSEVVAGAAEYELHSQPPIDANVVTGRTKIDLDTSLVISKVDRVVALERTRHRLPTALATMRDKGIEITPKVAKGLREGYTLGRMTMDLIEILRGLTGL